MPSAIYDIEVDQGSTYRNQVRLSSGGNVFDLSGYSARMKIARADNVRVMTLSSASGTELEITPSALSIHLSDELTRSLGLGHGKDNSLLYEIEIENSNGDITKLLRGTLKVIGGL